MKTIGRPLKTVALRSRRRSRRRGSTLVETALCVSLVLLPLTIGCLQFGIVLSTTHALEEVVREGGRFAAIHYKEGTFDRNENQGNRASDAPSLRHYLRDVAEDNGIPWNDIKNDIAVSPDLAARRSGDFITVTIVYPMSKRSILGNVSKSGFAKQYGGSGGMAFLKDKYTVASTFLMQ